jgi:hypothetical protein
MRFFRLANNEADTSSWCDSAWLELSAAIVHQALRDVGGLDGVGPSRKLDALTWLASPACGLILESLDLSPDAPLEWISKKGYQKIKKLEVWRARDARRRRKDGKIEFNSN